MISYGGNPIRKSDFFFFYMIENKRNPLSADFHNNYSLLTNPYSLIIYIPTFSFCGQRYFYIPTFSFLYLCGVTPILSLNDFIKYDTVPKPDFQETVFTSISVVTR